MLLSQDAEVNFELCWMEDNKYCRSWLLWMINVIIMIWRLCARDSPAPVLRYPVDGRFDVDVECITRILVTSIVRFRVPGGWLGVTIDQIWALCTDQKHRVMAPKFVEPTSSSTNQKPSTRSIACT